MKLFKEENIRYHSLLFIIFFFCSCLLLGQNFADKNYYLIDSLVLNELSIRDRKIIDSSLNIYHTNLNSLAKIEALNIIVKESWDLKIKQNYNKLVYNTIEQKIKNKSFKFNKDKKRWLNLYASSLHNAGFNSSEQGHHKNALIYYQKSYKISEEIKDSIGLGNSLNAIGFVYHAQGMKDKAIDNYFKSLAIREKIGDKNGIANSLGNIGYMYAMQNYPEKALTYFFKNLKIVEEIDNKYEIANTLNNIAFLYRKMGNTSEALEYYKRSLSIQETISNEKGIASVCANIGKLYASINNNELALEYYNKSLNISKKIGNKPRIAKSLYVLGKFYLELGNLNKALEYANQSMKTAKEINILQNMLDASDLLDKIYKRMGKWEKAYEMNTLINSIRDSIQTNEAEKELIRKQANYDIDKKNKEIELLAKQNEIKELKLSKSKIFTLLISLALLLALIIALQFYRSSRKRKHTNELLEKQKNEINEKNKTITLKSNSLELALKEKEILLKEVHHRVKNNLQIISSLLDIQYRAITDDKLKLIIMEGRNRIQSVALIHKMMYQSDTLSMVNMNDYLSELASVLERSYNVNKNIDLDILVNKNIDLPINIAVPISLIVNEAVCNSYKHGFNDFEKGKIEIGLDVNNNKYKLSITDNGIGFPLDFDMKKIKSIGFELIRGLTKQLKGDLLLKNEKKTEIIINFEYVS